MNDRNTRVLIVDDDEGQREGLAEWLRRVENFEVDTAGSGEKAVGIVRQAQGDYDAILIDQTLPAMTGIETMKRLRADHPALQVLLFTGQDPDAGVEALRQGAYRYLLKPFTNEELAMTTRAMAEARRQQVRAKETGWLQALLRIAQNAMTMPKEDLLNEVATTALDLLNSAVSIVWTLDRSEEKFQVAASAGEVDDDYCTRVCIDAQAPATKRSLESRQPIYLSDVTDPKKAPLYTEEHRAEARRRGWVSLLSASMIAEEQVVGILDIYTKEVRRFTFEDRDLLNTFASQAAIAFENARLLDDARNREQSLAQLVDIGEAVTRETTAGLRPVLEKAAQSACEFTGADYAAIYPYDLERQLFYDVDNVVVYGLREPRTLGKKPRKKGLAAIVRDIDELVVHDVDKGLMDEVDYDRIGIPGVDQARLLHFIQEEKFIRDEGVKAFVGLSLKAGIGADEEEQEVGILYIDFCQPHLFSTEELDMIRILGHQVGSAMQAAQLLHREQQRLDLLGALQDTLSHILAQREPAKVAETIATSASKLMSGKKEHKLRGAIWSCDHDARILRVEHSYDENLVGTILKFGEGLAGWVVENRQPRYINDYHAWEGRAEVFDEEPRRDLFASVIEVPLFWQETVIGVLSVSSPELVEFDNEDTKLLERFAGPAAIAIYNASLFEDAQRRISDLEIINKTAQIISTKLDTDDLLQAIASEVANQLRCTHCTLFFPQEVKSETVLVPTKTHGTRREVMSRRFRVGEGLAGWVYQHGESLALPDAKKDPLFASATDEQDPPRSMLVVPIKIGDQTIGVISADQDEYGWFNESDKRLVEALASQAGIAIERATTLALLQDIGNRITSTQAVDEVLQQIISGAIKLTNTTSGVIYSLDENNHITKSFMYPPGSYHPEPRVGSQTGFTQHVIDTGEVLRIPNIRNDDRVNPALYDHVQSMIAVPLKLEGRVIGVLYLNDAEPHDFTDTEVSLLLMLSDQAAIAIENARLFEELARTNKQLDRRVEELEVLTEIGRTVSNLGIDEILDLAYEQVGKIMNLNDAQVQIAFYDEDRDEVTFPLAVEQDDGEVIDAVRWSKREARYRGEDDDEVVKQFKPRPRGTRFGLTEYVIHTAQPVLIVEDFEQQANDRGIQVWPTFGRLDRPTHSWLGVPMIVQGRVIGIISIQSLEVEHAFDQGHAELLSTVASQAAVAIENARLYETMEQRIEERTRELKIANSRIAQREAIEVRDMIAADFVHRLNNLAGTTPIWVDLITEELTQSEPQMEEISDYLEKIRRDTVGLLRAAEQLNDPPTKQNVDAAFMLKSVVRQVRIQHRKSIEVVESIQPGLYKVFALPLSLITTVSSVITNAVEAVMSMGGGTISISAANHLDESGKKWIKIEVSDTGPGIPKESLNRVFTPFFSTKGIGRGYGLWRAKTIVEDLGGNAEIESEVGVGTSLSVQLPAV